ncbi:hypothetical protein M0802_003399 [Mischocyttarus mexicanus]|nr:hypothetical protein M0802_003399 [Mischocyttarus mexicanus]
MGVGRSRAFRKSALVWGKVWEHGRTSTTSTTTTNYDDDDDDDDDDNDDDVGSEPRYGRLFNLPSPQDEFVRVIITSIITRYRRIIMIGVEGED